MSLFRQLWIAIVGLMTFIFVGSFLISVLSARNYLEQQLTLKNIDNAESLALAISQQPNKDPVAVALVISAQFDTGHYQRIRLVDPQHRVVIDQQYKGTDHEAPAWFIQLFLLRATEGIAQIQDNWRQLGTLTVVSHNRFAYRELWHGSLKLLAWFLATGLIAVGIGSFVIRMIARPLNQVVSQAHAISERQFITLPEPKTLELKSVVRAINEMVARLKQFFAEEATRLDALRRAVNHDPVTGLANRELFMNQFQDALDQEESPAMGTLVLLRLQSLDELNRQIGHGATDQLLQRTAVVLDNFCIHHRIGITARLKGADFALSIPGENVPSALAAKLSEVLLKQLQESWPNLSEYFHLGATAYQRGNQVGMILAAADQMLATAEAKGANAWEASASAQAPNIRSAEAWYSLLNTQSNKHKLKLEFYPVTTAHGKHLHEEGFMRMQTETGDAWLVAGDFIPMAVRNKLTPTLDFTIAEFALAALQTSSSDIAINLCAESIADWGFRNQLAQLLDRHPDLCRRLCVEVTEYGAFRQIEAYRDFARTLKMRGCKIGLDHAGQRLAHWPQIADLGLDYLKVDYSFIRGIHEVPENQELLTGLSKMAHGMGIQVIATGVQSEMELAVLPALGFDGATGPAVVAE